MAERRDVIGRLATLPIRRRSERRPVVVATATLLFAAVFAIRATVTSTEEAIALLYVVPVALIAAEFGLRAGLAAAALAVLLLWAWALSTNVDLGVVGMLTRGVAYFAVGGVGGRFSDRMRAAQRRQHQLLESGLELAHLEAADRLPALLAERARELTASQGARVQIAGGGVAESGLWRRHGERQTIPIEARGRRHGTIALSRSSPADAEERAAVAILALQAAVAAENARLLESERERAVIQAQLHDAKLKLGDQARQLRELFERQEAERHETAHELSENAAQILTGMLLGLSALERRMSSGGQIAGLEALRADLGTTIQLLRSIAAGLRPAVRGLGLRAALEQLAARASGFQEVCIDVVDGDGPLTEDLETSAYRIVEEAVSAIGGGRRLSVASGGGELVLEVDAEEPISEERIALLRARVELTGGMVEVDRGRLRAVVPLEPPGAATAAGQAAAGLK